MLPLHGLRLSRHEQPRRRLPETLLQPQTELTAAHSWYFRDKFVCLETALDNPALVKNIVVPGAFSFWEIEGQPRVAYMKVGSLLPVRPALEANLVHGMKPVFFGCCEGGRGVVSAQNGLCRPVRAVPGVTARTTLFQK